MSVIGAYGDRAQEYADLLGSIEAMADQDRRCIETWAAHVDGPILDAGCGPGHWTAHLAARGHDARGLDPVPEFVEIARDSHPGVLYRVGSFADLQDRPGEWGGLLAWYSLIHLPPAEIPGVLGSLHEALRPAGHLLLGFFDGLRQEAFAHAVTTAQFWPAEQMAALLEEAGFSVQEVQRRANPGSRPHAAISARRR
ncbi:class I SAM-dependent methyltransferase [Brachybacterium sp. FME24]|uniref:class I SAM-dependent DNA methyltransferase n=1 Tax=Brachybacterium sp. FME24 TaxID=2742605 RepID=UPI0027146A09|nr:class I SAM-dependent methyltransferase [Brachybacterium sp. FME24]